MITRRDGLVLEVRTDKNGLPVHRWVRPDGAGHGAAAIPAPTTPPATVGPDALTAVSERLVSSSRRTGSAAMDTLLRTKTARLSPGTLGLLADLFRRDGSEQVARGIATMIDDHHHESTIREYAALASPLQEGRDDFWSMEAAVRGLHEYAPDVIASSADYSLADEHTQLQCRALVHAAARLLNSDYEGAWKLYTTVKAPSAGHDEGWVSNGDHEDGGWFGDNDDGVSPMPVVEDPGLAGLLVEHPGMAEQIMDAIEAEGFESAATIREIVLGDGSSALARGAL